MLFYTLLSKSRSLVTKNEYPTIKDNTDIKNEAINTANDGKVALNKIVWYIATK
jgi:hypothetical protein